MPKALEPKLTIKQIRFLKEYFKSGNGVQSAMKVYDTKDYSTAGAIASENLKKLKNPVKVLMEKHGLSLGALIVTLGEGLQAKKIHGTGDSYVEIEDHAVRHKFMETAGKWLGVENDINITGLKVTKGDMTVEYLDYASTS